MQRIGGESRQPRNILIMHSLQELEMSIEKLKDLVSDIREGNHPRDVAEDGQKRPDPSLAALLEILPSEIREYRDTIDTLVTDLKQMLL